MNHRVFSKESIDAHPLPQINKGLLPWLRRQREEIHSGAHYFDVKKQCLLHDGGGLEAAQDDRKSIIAKLGAKNTEDMAAIYRLQLAALEGKIEYYNGRLYLLNKIENETR